MASVTPSTVNLSYKKYETQPVGTQVAITIDYGNTILFKSIPSWMYIDNIVDNSDFSKTVIFNVNTYYCNNIAANNYSATIQVYSADYNDLYLHVSGSYVTFFGPVPEDIYDEESYQNIDYSAASSITYSVASIPVNLALTDSVLLSVSPTSLLFTMNSGDANPAGKIVQIASENSWTISKDVAWIGLSKTSGSNNDSFTVTVDSTGLGTGSYTGEITVAEGVTEETIQVTFTISDGNTTEDFLYVNPTEVEIVRNVNSSYSPFTNISLNSSAAWTATKYDTWISLSASSGSSGTDNITVSADITGLSPGVFAGEVEFTHGSFIRKVYITLRLYDLSLSAPENNTLYYAKDDVSLIMTSEKTTSFLRVDCTAETTNNHIIYPKKAPFFLGKATVNIGEETETFLTPTETPNVLQTSVVSLITPAIINFTAYEVDYFTGQTFDSLLRSNLFFLNGKTPVIANKLTYLPSNIVTTKNAVIALSIYKETPPNSVELSGAVTDTIYLNIEDDTKVYTLFLDLKDYELKDKDVIDVDFEGHVVNINIKEEDVESVLLLFENEWKLPEIIELTGDLNITGTASYTTQKLQVDKKVHERILEAEPGEEFTVISSWMYTQEQKEWLFKILDSKRMYLFINNTKIEVIPTFRKLELYNTNEHQVNYKLTFKKAIL